MVCYDYRHKDLLKPKTRRFQANHVPKVLLRGPCYVLYKGGSAVGSQTQSGEWVGIRWFLLGCCFLFLSYG